MFRTKAVEQLLLEDIAGIGRSNRSARRDEIEDEVETTRDDLERSRRRALAMVAIDWVAIAVLLFARGHGAIEFAIGPTQESILAMGLLAVAAHSGFRLGQLEKLGAVRRALDDLAERSQPAVKTKALD